jgi:hypothetical protein
LGESWLLQEDIVGRNDVPKGIYDVLRDAPARVHAQFNTNAGHNFSISDGIEAR